MRRMWMVLVAALGLPLIAVGVSLGGGTRPQPAVAAPAFSTDDVVDEFVAAIGYGVVSADWMPDGRMLASRLNGDVLLIDPNVVPATVRTYFSIPGVLAEAEIGLLDITVDPDFAANRFFYAYFTVAAGRRIEVARFRFENTGAATLATRTTIWQNPGIAVGGTYHVGGSINIGPDGKLYITTGDQLFGSNSQSLTNVWGKVLRINIDGTVPTDNPFYDGAGINVDEIWAYGLRNAYRASFDPVTGEFWVADVGGNTDATAYEEVDIVEAGKNYGWPNCEGPAGLPKAGPVCPTGVTGSIYAYRHNIGQGCCQNRAIIGGEVYRGGSFPASFRGSYVYADYPTGEFFWLERTSGGVTSGLLKDSSLTGLAQPVWLEVGPADGHIYWLNIGSDGQGQLRRLRYAGGSQRPPVIQTASASPSRGVGPLNVGFTATASDADGDPLTYRWDFGDGSAPSALASPSHVYNAPGVYEANLTVSSGADIVAAPPVKIVVGSPPVATIAPPGGGTNFVAGSSITLSGSATDADDGAVPASRLAWTVVFKHNEHTHPVMTGTGSTITVPIATTGHGYEGSTSYLVTLAATDTDGLTGSVTLELLPRKVALTVSANIATTVDVDGVTHDLPFDIDTLTGFQHTVAVPASVCDGETNWSFASWNTGGARQLDVVVPATDATYQATYEAVGGCGVNAATTTTTSTTNPTITPTTAMVEPPPVVPSALPEEYVGVVPARVLDTRGGEKPGSGSVTPVDVTRVGSAQVPDDAGAVVVNVTGVDATADGFVTVWPCGAERPEASNLNLVAGQTVSNLVVSTIGAGGQVCLFSEGGTHLLVDIEGYMPAGSAYVGLVPDRAMDTRRGDKPGPGSITSVDVLGVGFSRISDGARAVVLNVTGVDATADGFVTVWPCGTERPEASNLNLLVGQTAPNLVVSALGSSGRVCLFTEAGTHLLVDVAGYLPAVAEYVGVVPARVLDTRGGEKPGSGSVTPVDVTRVGSAQVPADAGAVVVNVTGVDATADGFVTVWPCGAERPEASNLNLVAGQTVPNLVVSKIGAEGRICLYSEAGTHLLVDIEGYWP